MKEYSKKIITKLSVYKDFGVFWVVCHRNFGLCIIEIFQKLY